MASGNGFRLDHVKSRVARAFVAELFLDHHLLNHNSIVSGKYINNVLEMNVRVILLHKSILQTDAHACGQGRSTHFRVTN